MLEKENDKNRQRLSSIEQIKLLSVPLPTDKTNDNDMISAFEQLLTLDLASVTLEKLKLLQDKIELHLYELGYEIYYELAEENDSNNYDAKYNFYLRLKQEIEMREKEQQQEVLNDTTKEDSDLLKNYSSTNKVRKKTKKNKNKHKSRINKALDNKNSTLEKKELSIIKKNLNDSQIIEIDKQISLITEAINIVENDLREKFALLKMVPSNKILQDIINNKFQSLKEFKQEKKQQVALLSHCHYIRLKERIVKLSEYICKKPIFDLVFDLDDSPFIIFATSPTNSATAANFMVMLGYEYNEIPKNLESIILNKFNISKIHYTYEYLEKTNRKYLNEHNCEKLLNDSYALHAKKTIRSSEIFIRLQAILNRVFAIQENFFEVFNFYELGNCVYFKNSTKLFNMYINEDNKRVLEKEQLYKVLSESEKILFRFFYEVANITLSAKPYFEYYQIVEENNIEDYNYLAFPKTTLIGFRLNENIIKKIEYLYETIVSEKLLGIKNNGKNKFPNFKEMSIIEKIAYLKLLYNSEQKQLCLNNATTTAINAKFSTNEIVNARSGLLFFHRKPCLDIQKAYDALEEEHIKLSPFI
jgi:hypothetical protein